MLSWESVILISDLALGTSSVLLGQRILKILKERHFPEWIKVQNAPADRTDDLATNRSVKFDIWLVSKKYKSLGDADLERLCGWARMSSTAFYISLMISVLFSLIWHEPGGDAMG
jgi:hypothetical protein